MIIDIHAHPLFRDVYPGKRSEEELKPPKDYILTYARFHKGELKLLTLGEFLERKEKAKVDKVVIFVRDDETFSGIKPPNEWVAELAKEYSQHFIPFYAIDPNKGAIGAQALRNACETLGFKGAKIHPYAARMYPNDPRAHPIYKTASDLGIPILFHSGPGPVGTRIDYCRPIFLDDVALEFPDLKIIIAHFSGPWYMETHALAWRHENVYVDISFYPEAFIKSLPWQLFEETIPDKILFGTDYPFNLPDDRVKLVEKLPLSDKTKRMILGENARKLLSI